MKKITKILLATDFSEGSYNAYKYALQLIDEMNVELLVLHVIPTMFGPTGLPMIDKLSMKTAVGDAVVEMKAFIQKGITEINNSKTNFYEKILTDIEAGDPVKTISKIVERNQINLIITGRRGQSNNIIKSLGSVSLSLLNNLKSDIFIIPNRATYKSIRKVGFATANYVNGSYYISRTKEVFQKKDISFEYVHIVTNATDYNKANFSVQQSYSSDNLNDKEINFSTINSDMIAESLITFTEEKRLDALVLLYRKRGVFEKLFSKNTAKEVIKLAEYPILILKSEKIDLQK